MGQSSRRRKGKGGTSRSSTPTPTENAKHSNNAKTDSTSRTDTAAVVLDENALVVLTSEKRRGIYECDYCHTDISQQPRIRCAVCLEFDLCLDCFTTSDHGAMMARIKAANQTQTELNKDGIESSSIVGVAISSAAAHHEDHHCYRVCDSTRYPVFPPGRILGAPAIAAAAAFNKRGGFGGGGGGAAAAAAEDTNRREQPGTADDMLVDGDNDAPPIPPPTTKHHRSVELSLTEDPKTIWTAEEDLRLIDAIKEHGLGNWVDIADAIGGNGSVGKTAKRCMERYLDDYLGRYGHILPQWTVTDNATEERMASNAPSGSDSTARDSARGDATTKNNNSSDAAASTGTSIHTDRGTTDNTVAPEAKNVHTPSEQTKSSKDTLAAAVTATATATASFGSAPKIIIDDEDRVRTSKRRTAASGISSSRKKLKVIPTESIPGYEKLWPSPYMPAVPGAVMGKEVARDQSCKAELAFVKATLAAPSKKEADKIRQTWIDTKLGRVGAPTVLPPRPHDAVHLLGSELAGFMPRRGDFDVEWENDAETALADMEFIRGDRPEDKELKLKVLQIYCEKLDEREKRKKFVLNRHLYDYRTYVQNDLKLPVDERDLVHRMRLFERFHTPDEHKQFISDILKAKRLRKEIAKLQMYRRIGIRTLAEAEMYELDKDRRQFHKKLEIDAKNKAAAAIANAKSGAKGGGTASSASASATSRTPSQFKGSDSLWKQYRTNDRKNRRSTSRSGNLIEGMVAKSSNGTTSPNKGGTNQGEKSEEKREGKTPNEQGGEGVSTASGTKSDGKMSGTDSKVDKNTTAASNKKDDPMEVDVPEKKKFDLSKAPCRDLLSRKERALCERLQIYPVQYLEIKKALIHESLVNGLLDKESSNSSKRTIVKIDVERRGNIIEFLVRAGWINRKLGDAALRVVTPQPSSQN